MKMPTMNCSARKAYSRRQGYTLIEILVVIGIIAILIGLLMPAVQRVREAASRTQCQNNLKQLGLGFHSHHAALGYFPSGGWDWYCTPTYINGVPAVGVKQQAGWGFQVLPFIEGDLVWRGGNATNDDDRIRIAMGTPNPIFFCPTRREPQTLTFSFPGFFNQRKITIALCDYAASNYDLTGVVTQYYPVRITEIVDGASNTLMLGEKRLNLRKLGQRQLDDDLGYASAWDNDTMRSTELPPLPDYSRKGKKWDGDWRFGSSHPHLFNVVLADGSVRTITYAIDATTFRYLGDKADGQHVDLNDF